MEKLNQFALRYKVDGVSGKTSATQARNHMKAAKDKELEETTLTCYVQECSYKINICGEQISADTEKFTCHSRF